MSESQMQPRPSEDDGSDNSFAEGSAPANNDAASDGQEDASMTSSPLLPVIGPDSIVLHIPSRPEYVRVVRLTLLGIASRMEFSFDDVEDMKLAVSEACNNAILHADPELADCHTKSDAPRTNETEGAANSTNGASKPGSVMVAVTPYDNRLEITVVDEGYIAPPGLPRPGVEPPHGTDAELRESGLGLYLMQSLMDEVEHQTGANLQTVVRLVKYLPSHKIQGEIEDNNDL